MFVWNHLFLQGISNDLANQNQGVIYTVIYNV